MTDALAADVLSRIADGPAGAAVGAFFDLDGTLVEGFTPAAHARHRIRHRQAKFGELLGTAEAAIRYRFGRMEFDRLIVRAAGYLRGELLAELDALGEALFTPDISRACTRTWRRIVGRIRRRGTPWC